MFGADGEVVEGAPYSRLWRSNFCAHERALVKPPPEMISEMHGANFALEVELAFAAIVRARSFPTRRSPCVRLGFDSLNLDCLVFVARSVPQAELQGSSCFRQPGECARKTTATTGQTTTQMTRCRGRCLLRSRRRSTRGPRRPPRPRPRAAAALLADALAPRCGSDWPHDTPGDGWAAAYVARAIFRSSRRTPATGCELCRPRSRAPRRRRSRYLRDAGVILHEIMTAS